MGSGDRPRSGAAGGARVLATRRVYEGKVLSLDLDEVEEPGDVRAKREVVRHRGSVAALPVHEDGRLVLVRQYRYPVDAFVWELPHLPLDARFPCFAMRTPPAARMNAFIEIIPPDRYATLAATASSASRCLK